MNLSRHSATVWTAEERLQLVTSFEVAYYHVKVHRGGTRWRLGYRRRLSILGNLFTVQCPIGAENKGLGLM